MLILDLLTKCCNDILASYSIFIMTFPWSVLKHRSRRNSVTFLSSAPMLPFNSALNSQRNSWSLHLVYEEERITFKSSVI